MEKLLVSACLLGVSCKYSGGSNLMDGAVIAALKEKYILIPVCPEVEGGLSTPREPCERIGDKVISCTGKDCTREYHRGAQIASELYRMENCSAALLKECSPSCGSGVIYDGSFSHTKIPGYGVTGEVLKNMGARLYSEKETDKLI